MSEQYAVHGNGHSKQGMNGHSSSKHAMDAYSAAELEAERKGKMRWQGIARPYSAEDVIRLRGSITIEYTLARLCAGRLCNLLNSEPNVADLGALTVNQAIHQGRSR